MGLLPIVLVAGVFAFASAGLSRVDAVQKLEYFNPRIKVGKITLTQLELILTISIRNPTSTDIPIDYFTGNIMYEGSKLTSFTFNANGSNVKIKARTNTDLPFTVLVSNVGAISTIVKIAKALAGGTKVGTTVKVDSILYAAGLDIPVKFTYNLATNNVTMQGVGGPFDETYDSLTEELTLKYRNGLLDTHAQRAEAIQMIREKMGKLVNPKLGYSEYEAKSFLGRVMANAYATHADRLAQQAKQMGRKSSAGSSWKSNDLKNAAIVQMVQTIKYELKKRGDTPAVREHLAKYVRLEMRKTPSAARKFVDRAADMEGIGKPAILEPQILTDPWD